MTNKSNQLKPVRLRKEPRKKLTDTSNSPSINANFSIRQAYRLSQISGIPLDELAEVLGYKPIKPRKGEQNQIKNANEN